ncbi:hypothetical protein C8Q79DRAFT_593150 [Trametes meyenii]|nr:hypothetical protein C8Q79DRAFT_593150 [Trametes meyenii]
MATAPKSTASEKPKSSTNKPKSAASEKPKSAADKTKPGAADKPKSTKTAKDKAPKEKTVKSKPASIKKPKAAAGTKKSKADKPADDGKAHPSWKDMIKECVVAHKEESRTGVSRSTIKKFVSEKYGLDATSAVNTSHLNRAIANGAEEGIFALPKGPSGKVKLAPKTKPAPANEVREAFLRIDPYMD